MLGQAQRPRQDPCHGRSPPLAERATFEPTNAKMHWDKAREAPPWWHADLCEDIECSRSNEDRKATILIEETHKTPGKILAREASAPRQDPCRATRQDHRQAHRQGHYQARTREVPAAFPTQPPTQPAGQAPAWQHANLRGGSTTVPPQLSACLHGTACIAGQGTWRSKEEQRRTGRASPPSPIK